MDFFTVDRRIVLWTGLLFAVSRLMGTPCQFFRAVQDCAAQATTRACAQPVSPTIESTILDDLYVQGGVQTNANLRLDGLLGERIP